MALVTIFPISGEVSHAKCVWRHECDYSGNCRPVALCDSNLEIVPIQPLGPAMPGIDLNFIRNNPVAEGFNQQREADTLDQLRQLQFQLELQEFRRAQDARIRSKLIALEALRKLAREENLLAEEWLVLDEYLVRNGLKEPGISIRDWWYGARSPG